MAERKQTLKERIQELADRFGEWLDEVLPVPEPALVPVPVRRPPEPRRRR